MKGVPVVPPAKTRDTTPLDEGHVPDNGMFGLDVLYGGKRLTDEFTEGDVFILWGVHIVSDQVPTDIGMATKTALQVSRGEKPTDVWIVNTLASAIATKAKAAKGEEFPCIVRLHTVPSREEFGSEATVLSFVKPWTGAKPDRLPDFETATVDATDLPDWAQ